MSGLLTGAVLRHAPYRGRRLLVLVALADAAGDTGRLALSWDDLAPNARTTPRHFREEVDALMADGRVLRFRRPGHTNILQLRFPAEWGALPPEVTGEKRVKRANPAPKTKRAMKQRPATQAPVEPTPAPVAPAPVELAPDPVPAPDPAPEPEPEPEPISLAGYVEEPRLWRPLASLLRDAMSPTLYGTFFGGARLFRPQSSTLPADAPHLLLCRNKSAWRMALSDTGIAYLASAVAGARIPITILPVPPQAAAVLRDAMEVSSYASH